MTPLDIRNQVFRKTLRGFDPVEVETFLELVANEYGRVSESEEQLSKKVMALESELKHFKEVEKTLKQTLYNVQESSQQSRENSEKAASLLRREAELSASEMIEKARREVHNAQQEVQSLLQQKESFANRLRHLLKSQIELLDVLTLDDVDKAKLRSRPVPQPVAARPAEKPVSAPVNPAPKPSAPVDVLHGKDFFNEIFDENPKKENKS